MWTWNWTEKKRINNCSCSLSLSLHVITIKKKSKNWNWICFSHCTPPHSFAVLDGVEMCRLFILARALIELARPLIDGGIVCAKKTFHNCFVSITYFLREVNCCSRFHSKDRIECDFYVNVIPLHRWVERNEKNISFFPILLCCIVPPFLHLFFGIPHTKAV